MLTNKCTEKTAVGQSRRRGDDSARMFLKELGVNLGRVS